MRTTALLPAVPSSALALLLPACSNGSSGVGSVEFRVESCTLGCSALGTCTVTEIQRNPGITLSFSKEVDPASVNQGSFSVRDTVAGQQVTASYSAVGNEVTCRVSASHGIGDAVPKAPSVQAFASSCPSSTRAS